MNEESIDRNHGAVDTAEPCGCVDPLRRTTVKVMAGAALVAAGVRPSWAAGEGPQVGDYLVKDGDDSKTPLTSADLKVNAKQLVVFPMDPKTKTVRDSPNTNRLIVMKLDQKDLGPETAKVAAEGIVGYSAVCTHQNCVVNGWVEKDKELLCVCHFSKFSPLRAGEVTGGPAPRPLPSIPLKIDGGKLAIAGDFSAKPGGQV